MERKKVQNKTKKYKVHCGGRGRTFNTLSEAAVFANAMQKQTREVYAVTEYTARRPKTSPKKVDKPATASKAKANTQKAHAVKSNKTTGKRSSANKKSVKTAVSAKKATAKPAATRKPTATTAKKVPSGSSANLITIEIRKHSDAKGGHPHIMVDVLDKQNVSVGITHDNKKGRNHPNIPLEHNPLGENRQAYIRREGTVDEKNKYSSAKRTGQITEADNAKVKQIADKAKAKALKKPKK